MRPFSLLTLTASTRRYARCTCHGTASGSWSRLFTVSPMAWRALVRRQRIPRQFGRGCRRRSARSWRRRFAGRSSRCAAPGRVPTAASLCQSVCTTAAGLLRLLIRPDNITQRRKRHKMRSPSKTSGACMLLAATLSLPIAALAQNPPVSPKQTTQSNTYRQATPDRVEQRIADLHARLRIAPDQQALWDPFAQVMRDNAQHMRQAVADRADKLKTMNASENMLSCTPRSPCSMRRTCRIWRRHSSLSMHRSRRTSSGQPM